LICLQQKKIRLVQPGDQWLNLVKREDASIENKLIKFELLNLFLFM
jgi:hypothetical protein